MEDRKDFDQIECPKIEPSSFNASNNVGPVLEQEELGTMYVLYVDSSRSLQPVACLFADDGEFRRGVAETARQWPAP